MVSQAIHAEYTHSTGTQLFSKTSTPRPIARDYMYTSLITSTRKLPRMRVYSLVTAKYKLHLNSRTRVQQEQLDVCTFSHGTAHRNSVGLRHIVAVIQLHRQMAGNTSQRLEAMLLLLLGYASCCCR